MTVNQTIKNVSNSMLLVILLTMLLSITASGFAGIDESPIKENISIGGDFTLTDHNGNKFELQQLRGKLVLIFFGYTFCPDICPTELSTLARVLKSLGDDADKVASLFISIDPERDTPEKLKQYVPFYSPHLVGLTGTLEEVNKVADAYHVQRKIHQREESKSYYLVDHSANLYVVGADGKMLHLVPFGLPAEHIEQVVREEIKKLKK